MFGQTMSKNSPCFLYPEHGFPERRDELVETVVAEAGYFFRPLMRKA